MMSAHGPAAPTRDPAWFKWTLISVALAYVVIVLALPLLAVFVEALRKGEAAFFAAFNEPAAAAAIQLTLLVTAIAVPLNTVFGLAAAWAITKFEFVGKSFLTTLIDLRR